MDILRAGATNKKTNNCVSATRNCVSDEHINKLIKAAFEKYKEEQKPKDTVQENIQKDFEKVDCVQKALDANMKRNCVGDPTAAVRQNIQDDKKHDWVRYYIATTFCYIFFGYFIFYENAIGNRLISTSHWQ